MSYKIEYATRVTKDIRRIPRSDVSRIMKAIKALSDNPRPVGCKKLVQTDRTYRIRIGNYRIIYDIYDDHLVIRVIRIGHRRDVY